VHVHATLVVLAVSIITVFAAAAVCVASCMLRPIVNGTLLSDALDDYCRTAAAAAMLREWCVIYGVFVRPACVTAVN